MSDEIRWNVEKDAWLKENRGLSFLMVEEAISEDQIIDDFQHPQRENQRILIFQIGGKCVAVPYVTEGKVRFLKTMYFSRDLDKIYGAKNG